MAKALALALWLAATLSYVIGDDFSIYENFQAHNDSQTCTADEDADFFIDKVRGVNLGGWMVLEPWITPSLFYQFLGKGEHSTATDIYSFCKVLGPVEANKQLRRHWDAWVTEDIIKELKASGAVNSLRLPVGDWMYVPYGPYVGCTDGALEYVDKLLDWADENDLSVMLDIHGAKDSQNGFDNSGQAQGFTWTSIVDPTPGDIIYEHWPILSAGWMGTFDPVKAVYTDINHANIEHTLNVIDVLVDRYKDKKAVMGLEPLNEPWKLTPILELKKFYWEGYLRVKRKAPHWVFFMHDSFRLDTDVWGGFMAGCPGRVLDTHLYQAWMNPSARETFYENACSLQKNITEIEEAFGPVVVGEWSLATDNCAMWLNGFNDNLPGFPRLPCKYIPCTDPYMGTEQPGTPVDPDKPAQGPFGTGMSTPAFGMCPTCRDWRKRTIEGKEYMEISAEAGFDEDATHEVMTALAKKHISSYYGHGHGFYFWNFRTDLYEPRWSFMLALEKGWIPKYDLTDDAIVNTCQTDKDGFYLDDPKTNELEEAVDEVVYDTEEAASYGWVPVFAILIAVLGYNVCVNFRTEGANIRRSQFSFASFASFGAGASFGPGDNYTEIPSTKEENSA